MAEEKDIVKELGLSVVHVGINAADKAQAQKIAEEFSTFFGFSSRQTKISIFSSDLIEIMEGGGRGRNGHIALGTKDVDRAIAYFAEKGMHVIPETVQKDAEGRTTFAYLDKEIGGFAFHLKRI